jgi:hypothetical protein
MINRFFVLCFLTWSLTAFAQKEAAGKDHFDRGMVFFNLQDYPSAITELKAAYTADPSKSDYLFALAQAQRLGGDFQSAIGSYKAFLRTASGKSGAAAEALIHACENELAKAKADKAAAEKAALEKAAADKAAADKAAVEGEQRRAANPGSEGRTKDQMVVVLPPASPPAVEEHHWYTDGAGLGLLIPGVLGVGAGAVFLALGNGDVRSSMTMATQAGHDKVVASGQMKQMVGVIALSAGGALAAGGIIRAVVVGSRDDSKPTAMVVPIQGGAAAVLSGSF